MTAPLSTSLNIVVHDISAPTKQLSMPLKVPSWLIESLQKDFPTHQILHAKTWEDVDRYTPDMDVFLGAHFDKDRLSKAKRLRYIHSASSGVEFLLYPELIQSPVIIVKSPGIQSTTVAEHAMMMIMTLAKRAPEYVAAKERKEWVQNKMIEEYQSIRELKGSRLVLVGIGNIGSILLKMVKAFDMYVILVRLHPERGRDLADEVVGIQKLKEVVHNADFLVLAAPLTKTSYEMINEDILSNCSPRTYIINISRGRLIQQDALIEALKSRKITGAALDVFDEEPIPRESALWTLPNVFITPHSSGSSEHRWERTYTLWRDNLRRFIAGEQLENVVDKQRGF